MERLTDRGHNEEGGPAQCMQPPLQKSKIENRNRRKSEMKKIKNLFSH